MADKKEQEEETMPPVRLGKKNHRFVQILAKQTRRTMKNQLDIIVEQWKEDHPKEWKDLISD